MADIDKGVGRPGSDGPDLGGLDEDILTPDLEADLGDDLGDDGLGEDALGDSDGSAEEDESEESEDRSGDDDGDGFGDSTFSGGFGDESFLGGTAGTDGSGFSSSSPDSFDFDGAGADSFDFGDFDEAGDGADRTGSLGSSHGRSGPSDGGTSAGAGAAPQTAIISSSFHMPRFACENRCNKFSHRREMD